MIRGWDSSNPVLLYLHGGPGGPLFPRVRTFESFTNLERYLVMVYWEQRGAAKSYHPKIPIETMTIEQFVSDIEALSRFLIGQFSAHKIYLMGASWGSLIGLLAARESPELYYAFIGVGQLVNPLENDRLTYELALETAARLDHKEALAKLKAVGTPPYHYQQLIVQRRWLTRFEKIILAERGIQAYPEFNTVEKLLATPEYSILDILRMGRDPYFSLKCLWNDRLYELDLIREAPEIKIPVYFITGRHDYITPSALVEEYYQQLSAPMGKKLIWFEDSGHEPYFQEPDKFREVVVNMVLGETYMDVGKLE